MKLIFFTIAMMKNWNNLLYNFDKPAQEIELCRSYKHTPK
jgi:hypothetical protein